MQRFIILGLAVLMLTAACATSAYQPAQPEVHYPAISDVPPSFYGYDPTLEYWYTYPYWDPDRGP